MILLSAMSGADGANAFVAFCSGLKPILINYIIPSVVSLGIIKIIQILARNVKPLLRPVQEDEPPIAVKLNSHNRSAN